MPEDMTPCPASRPWTTGSWTGLGGAAPCCLRLDRRFRRSSPPPRGLVPIVSMRPAPASHDGSSRRVTGARLGRAAHPRRGAGGPECVAAYPGPEGLCTRASRAMQPRTPREVTMVATPHAGRTAAPHTAEAMRLPAGCRACRAWCGGPPRRPAAVGTSHVAGMPDPFAPASREGRSWPWVGRRLRRPSGCRSTGGRTRSEGAPERMHVVGPKTVSRPWPLPHTPRADGGSLVDSLPLSCPAWRFRCRKHRALEAGGTCSRFMIRTSKNESTTRSRGAPTNQIGRAHV